MPTFVRAGLRTNRWLETDGRAPADFPADVITDLRTQGDQLSVYEADDVVSAERIAIAIAAGKQKPDETGYAVFDRDAVGALGVEAKKEKGGSPDADANDRHYNLNVGTTARLIGLAGVIAQGEIIPILRKRVEELLRGGLQKKELDESRMPGLIKRLRSPDKG